MRILAMSLFACCVASCATEPLDEATESSTDEKPGLYEASEPADSEFLDDESALLTCSTVKLLYCRDPNRVPHFPTFCFEGCTVSEAGPTAVRLCRNTCGNISCDNLWPVRGCP